MSMSQDEYEKKRCHYCGNWTDYNEEGMIKLDYKPICSDCFKDKTKEVTEK